MKQMKSATKVATKLAILAALIVVALMLVRFGAVGKIRSFGGALAPRPSTSRSISKAETTHTVIPGKEACGIQLGESLSSVVSKRGFPQSAISYPAVVYWVYDITIVGKGYDAYKDYKLFVALEVVYPEKTWQVVFIQCFYPSTSGVLKTGANLAEIKAAYGEPETILYWDRGPFDEVYKAIYVYDKRGVSVVIDVNTQKVDGFMVGKPQEE